MERLTSYRRKVAEYNSSIPTTTVVIQTQHNFPVSIATKDDTSKLLSNANKSQPGNSSVNNIGNISLSSIAKEIKPVILPDEKGMPLKSNFDNRKCSSLKSFCGVKFYYLCCMFSAVIDISIESL